MFERQAASLIRQSLGWHPATAILGPRQVGKTTLARQIAAEFPNALYLDLENADDRAPLQQPAAFLRASPVTGS